MSVRAYVVPVGIHVTAAGERVAVAFMQRKNHLLPGDYCDRLLAVGGRVEAGETALQAALRELEEEVPGWRAQARVPNTHDGFRALFADASITVFTTLVDVGPRSTRAFTQSTTEGVPAVLTRRAIDALPDDRWVYPQMKAPLAAHLTALVDEREDIEVTMDGGSE